MTGDPSGEPPRPDGHLRHTSPGSLTLWAGVGLVAGWVLHPVAERLSGSAPIVTWLPTLVFAFVAAILGTTAWLTWRSVHVRHEYIDADRAVNRLVLARSCALVGALVAGGYTGYAVSWLGVGAELANQRVIRSLAAAGAGAAITASALFLERACRIRSDGDEA